MHTEVIQDVTFHFNGDYSGEVLVHAPSDLTDTDVSKSTTVRIPFDVLRTFVLRSFISAEIGKLEQMSDVELVRRYAPGAI